MNSSEIGGHTRSLLGMFFGRFATVLSFGVGVVLALLTFLLPGTVLSGREKGLLAALLVVVSIAISLFILLRDETHASNHTTRLRNVLPGTHYYSGMIVLLLDRNPSFEPDQILTLYVTEHDVDVPLAILRIDAFTTGGFPQAVILRAFSETQDELTNYLADRSRWRALFVAARVKESYLKREVS